MCREGNDVLVHRNVCLLRKRRWVPIRVGERIGDYRLTEIRRFQMADKPPSTDNSTPFTKLESSEARNSATVAISSG